MTSQRDSRRDERRARIERGCVWLAAILAVALVLLLFGACKTKKRVAVESLHTERGVLHFSDTTKTDYQVEVITNYVRDTIVQVVERYKISEQRGITTHRDTIYIQKTDTIQEVQNVVRAVKDAPPPSCTPGRGSVWRWLVVLAGGALFITFLLKVKKFISRWWI